MSSVITSRIQITERTLPWYRYGWPWFLISIPLISIGLSSVMLYLALHANNSLVVDDYYKEGKAYNLVIERDRLASLLGLKADVAQGTEGVIVELDQNTPGNLPAALLVDAQSASAEYTLPDELTLRWVHVTQAKLDGTTTLRSIGGARYIAPNVTLPNSGKFRLHLEPVLLEQLSGEYAYTSDSNWRLIGALTNLDVRQTNSIMAPAIEKVFSRNVLQ